MAWMFTSKVSRYSSSLISPMSPNVAWCAALLTRISTPPRPFAARLTTPGTTEIALDKKRLTPFALDEDGEGLGNDRAPAQRPWTCLRQSPRTKEASNRRHLAVSIDEGLGTPSERWRSQRSGSEAWLANQSGWMWTSCLPQDHCRATLNVTWP
jgi:hypothetical protein